MKSEHVVQCNLDFYNQRDIDGFMSCLSEDIAIFNLGDDQPLLTGLGDVRAMYGALFENSPELQSKILKRIVIIGPVST